MEAWYECPVCGGRMDLGSGLSAGRCRKCAEARREPEDLEDVKNKIRELEKYFSGLGGMTPLQRAWAARFFQGMNLVLSSPTGTGKTTFALNLARYLADRGKRSLLVFPTRVLVEEASLKTGAETSKEEIFSGNFGIAAMTSAMFHRNHERIPKDVDMLFMDDVDSVLKSWKAFNRLSSFNSQVILSSATLKPKPRLALEFMKRFGVLPGRPGQAFRNVRDVVWHGEWDVLKELGSGILLVRKKDEIEEAVKKLGSLGLEAWPYWKLEEFKERGGVIVGVSHPKNPLVRGIDLPGRIRFVAFAGVPGFEISEITEGNAEILLRQILPFLKDDGWKGKKGEELVEYLREKIEEIRDELERSERVEYENGKFFIPDSTTYIQASGRASRLTPDGVTRGYSIIFPDSEKRLKALERVLKWRHGITFTDGIEPAWLEGKDKIIPRAAVVVVESPTKAKTISSFFGKPSRILLSRESMHWDTLYVLTPSIGHVTDLGDEGLFGITPEGPLFAIQKPDRIREIRRIVMGSDLVIATDPDREGEKIAADIWCLASAYAESVRRAEFHEVTRHAFLRAVSNPRGIDMDRVSAQLIRRLADRVIGFGASQQVQKEFSRKTLSAGRVQTPVLGWIIRKWEESRERMEVGEFELFGLKFRIAGLEPGEKEALVEIEERIEEPVIPPFETQSLLRSSRLPPEKTMEILQSLFEKGLITYHRTDSVHVSQAGTNLAREWIEENYPGMFLGRQFSQEGAHECIRPTKPYPPQEASALYSLSRQEEYIYRLVFTRFMASQMKSPRVRKGELRISVDGKAAEREILLGILEDGWNVLLPMRTVPAKRGRFRILVRKRKVPKAYPMRYAEAIEMMKERGIGRPSTYAITLQKLKERRYVIDRKGFLIPTRLGRQVYSMLMSGKWKKYLEEGFTRDLEEKMDRAEEGRASWSEEIKNLICLLERDGLLPDTAKDICKGA